MNDQEKIAYEWALNQDHKSVAASYARILAKYIQKTDGATKIVEQLETRYPNWHKFRDVIEALDIHIANMTAVIKNLRG